MIENKIYLGDSVYAEFDSGDVILTTNNGHPDDPRNRIVLEPGVVASFTLWLARIAEQWKAAH